MKPFIAAALAIATLGVGTTSTAASSVTPSNYAAQCFQSVSSPSSPRAGGSFTISGSNASGAVSIKVGSASAVNVTAAGNGTFSRNFTAPRSPTSLSIVISAVCTASESLQTQTLNLNVVAAKPNAPTGATATLPAKNTPRLTWTAPAAGALPTSYVVKYKVNNKGTERTMGTSNSTTLQKKLKLKKWKTLQFFVYSSNSAGLSPASAPFTLRK
jgi:hypothetical protein